MSIQTTLAEAIARMLLAQEQLRTELASGLQQFHNGQRLQGARAVDVGPTGRGPLVWGGDGRLVGWSLRATGDDPVVVHLTTGAGDVLAVLEVAASSTQWFGPGGVSFADGLRLEVIGAAGDLAGAVYVGAVD